MRRPLTVVLDITERCNLKCVMCYFSVIDRLRFAPVEVELSRSGNMPVSVFEKIANDLFPRARRASLGCATEPLIHPEFEHIVELAGRHRVPDLWFPTNLLPLTESKARAIVAAGVRTVAVSIDGFTRESYEAIRVGGRFELLISRLELLREVKRRLRSRSPRLRFIFTWMRSNRGELRRLPEFAVAQGADEIDVRYVCPTVEVDNSAELLSHEDPAELNAELAATAREAVARGLRLSSYPEFENEAEKPRDLLGRLRRRVWYLRAGLDRLEYRRHRAIELRQGCAYPGNTYVVRPNGSVFPCQYWEGDPIGSYPDGELSSLSVSPGLTAIRDGLVNERPIGTCRTCTARRDAFYRPFHDPGGDRDRQPASTKAVTTRAP